MKISKYLLLLLSVIGLATFVGCGNNDPDPTVAQLIAADGKPWTMSADPSFSVTFTAEATNATSFSLNRGSSASPVFMNCNATTGTWAAGGTITGGNITGTVTFTSGGTSSTVNATYDGATRALTLSFNTPHPDNTIAGCGDKNETLNTYVLTQAQ